MAYLAADHDMRLDNVAEARTAEGIVRYENPGVAVWRSYSKHGDAGNMAWFDLQEGNVVVKNPDAEIVRKMCQVAAALNARVQGEEGEYYPTAETPRSRTPPPTKTVRWFEKLFQGR